jgi:hypothetical protein
VKIYLGLLCQSWSKLHDRAVILYPLDEADLFPMRLVRSCRTCIPPVLLPVRPTPFVVITRLYRSAPKLYMDVLHDLHDYLLGMIGLLC